jgi:hypothetical protein
MCAVATDRKLRIVESPSEALPQTELVPLTAPMTVSTCAVILAFGGLWLEFFRNVAALPSALMFWHFHL